MNIGTNRAVRNKVAAVNVFSVDELRTLATLARKGVFEICLAADHGHVGGSSAAAELFVALYFGGVLRFNPADPDDPRRDKVLVRGHLGPLRYKLFSWLGWLDEDELSTYRRIGSRLHGHEDHLETPGVDLTPSGSLGMLLSYGVGAALGACNDGMSNRTFVFLGDGEEQEGVVSEAARHAAHLKLGNLVAIIDRNGKLLSNPVLDTDSSSLAQMWEGYGWKVFELHDGNDVEQVLTSYQDVLEASADTGKPILLIADTVKGKGLAGAEDHFSGYHTMSRLKNETVQEAIEDIESELDHGAVTGVMEQLAYVRDCTCGYSQSSSWTPVPLNIQLKPDTPNHPDDCQFDYFMQLRELIDDGVMKRDDLYFLTADVTTVETVKALKLDQMFRFYNVGIREQHMIAMTHGLTVSKPEARVLINSFDAFNYRCIDQINVALQGHGNMIILGDVAGLTNSRNGKTHQTTGLPAALLAMEGLTFLEPWDAADTFACLNWALGESRRVVYIRAYSAPATAVPDADVTRTITYYTVREPEKTPDMVMMGSGLTVNSCLEAADMFQKEGVSVRVINVVNPNSLDEGFADLVEDGQPLLTAYNGHPKVLRQAVADALLGRSHPSAVASLGFDVGNTGTFAEMYVWTGLDSDGVLQKARSLL